MTKKKETITEEINPDDYFKALKAKKQETTSEFLNNLYDNGEALLKKFHTLGQNLAIRKLLFTLEVIEKEKTLFDKGFKTFLYRDDVEYYIDKVTDKTVKIIELANYPRVIPDEVAEKIIELKNENIFDEYFIVFTDYTGEVARETKKEDIKKDPIVFGVFLQDANSARGKFLHDRFYYIADWEDEYCDLTLSKMITEMSAKGIDIERSVSDASGATVEEIKDYMAQLNQRNNGTLSLSIPPSVQKKKNFFSKVTTWLKR